MPTVASYVEAAKGALLAGDADQAAVVCRHVLSYWPKHVEANCLLAEALRDQGETDQAKDLYLRVVSADPTNLIAHWALSLIAEAEHDHEWATWELLRAWEAGPEHPELRKELQRLTGSKPSLTPLALAQLYAAGGLFDKAVEELRKLLAAEPGRLDVAVALAENLWRAGLPEEAARACETILDDSPDCLKANLLLGCWLYGGSDEGRERGRGLLQRARELDPDVAVAAELLAGQPLPDVLATAPPDIPPLGETQARLAKELATDAAVSMEAREPEALALVGDVASNSGRQPAGEPTLPGQPSPPESASDLAAWLQDAGQQSATVQKALEARLAPRAAQPAPVERRAPEDLDPEWRALLAQEITLDQESEERLSQALGEMGLVQGEQAEEGWLEVPTASSGPRQRLSDVARDQTPTGAAAGAGEGARTRGGRGGRRGMAASLGGPATAGSGGTSQAGTPTGRSGERSGADLERAAALWRGGDPEGALETYRQILGSAPESAGAVVAGIRGLIEAFPDLADAHRVLGDAYMRAGRFQQAIDEYNWALASRQSDREAPG